MKKFLLLKALLFLTLTPAICQQKVNNNDIKNLKELVINGKANVKIQNLSIDQSNTSQLFYAGVRVRKGSANLDTTTYYFVTKNNPGATNFNLKIKFNKPIIKWTAIEAFSYGSIGGGTCLASDGWEDDLKTIYLQGTCSGNGVNVTVISERHSEAWVYGIVGKL